MLAKDSVCLTGTIFHIKDALIWLFSFTCVQLSTSSMHKNDAKVSTTSSLLAYPPPALTSYDVLCACLASSSQLSAYETDWSHLNNRISEKILE